MNFLNMDFACFEGIVNKIYPTELQCNTANINYTKALLDRSVHLELTDFVIYRYVV